MLKLSTKGRYGLRLMLELALNYSKGPVTLKEVSRRQEISEKYLEQLTILLKRARIVKAVRGAHGGYALSKSPREINLNDIVLALEESLCIVECTKNPRICKRSATCVARDIWQDISHNIFHQLVKLNLETLARRQKNKLSVLKLRTN